MTEEFCPHCGSKMTVSKFFVGKAKGFTPYPTCSRCRALRSHAELAKKRDSASVNDAMQGKGKKK